MPAPRVSVPRLVAEFAIGSACVVAMVVVLGFGVVQWLLTILVVVYPCGETYLDHPGCRLADPDAVTIAYLLMLLVPLASIVVGILVGVRTFERWRHVVLPLAVALLVATAASLAGHALLAAALGRTVAW